MRDITTFSDVDFKNEENIGYTLLLCIYSSVIFININHELFYKLTSYYTSFYAWVNILLKLQIFV